jgi:hypothetical protein
MIGEEKKLHTAHIITKIRERQNGPLVTYFTENVRATHTDA